MLRTLKYLKVIIEKTREDNRRKMCNNRFRNLKTKTTNSL